MNQSAKWFKRTVSQSGIVYKVAKNSYSFFRNVFSKYGYIRNYIIFPIQGIMRIAHIPPYHKKYNQIANLKSKYRGKKCFIIATGPSLKWSDLNKLKGEITFGMNSLYRGYKDSDFRPNYYFILDKDVLIDLDKTEYSMLELSKNGLFLNDMIKRSGENIIPTPINYLDHWFNYGNAKYNYRKNLKFSKDPLYGLYDKYTTTISIIETAIYMGFKEIYLLGVDCNYAGKNLHFRNTEYDQKDWAPNKNLDVAEIQRQSNIIGYEFIKEEAEKRGIKIYNSTRGGQLEVFERVDFDSINFN